MVRRLFASANTPDGYVTHLVAYYKIHIIYTFTGNIDQGKEEF